MIRNFALLGAALGGTLLGSGAMAQTGGTQADIVVVRGEKIERSLQDTPTSVDVTTALQIERESLQELADILQRTANVADTYGGSGFTIRGISNTNVSGGGSSELTTVYLDGAPLPSRLLYNGPLDLWDVAQVEVLRGPQSTLQGRNTLAGAVIIQSREPGYEYEARARLRASDVGEQEFALAAGGPVVDDELAFRIAYEDRQADGIVSNPTRNDRSDALDAYTLRGALLWEPSALPEFSARLNYLRSEREGGYVYTYVRTDTANPFEDRLDLSNDPNSSDTSTDLASLTLDYALSDSLTLTSVTSWNEARVVGRYDGDFTPASLSYGMRDETYEATTQEVRLSYGGERLEGVLGAYYSRRIADEATQSLTNVETPGNTIQGLLLGYGATPAQAAFITDLYLQALPVIPVDFSSQADREIESYALFGDASYQIAPRAAVLFGFRYDREEHAETLSQTTAFAGVYPNPADYGAPGSLVHTAVQAINGGVAGIVAQAGGQAPASDPREFEAFLPKLGVTYDWTENVATSFIVQRGYRSGGLSTNIARASVTPYDPEFTWNYELSLRSSWFDDALTLNANAFYIDWTEQQVSVNLGLNSYDTQTLNAGQSHVYGLEIETRYAPSNRFDVYASLGHTRTEFDEFTVDVGQTGSDFSGAEFAYAPHWTVSAGANYNWDSGLTANLNASHQSDAFTTVGVNQADRPKADARTLMNGRFGYRGERWGAYLYAQNLLDEEYVEYVYPGREAALLGRPRVFGITLEAEL